MSEKFNSVSFMWTVPVTLSRSLVFLVLCNSIKFRKIHEKLDKVQWRSSSIVQWETRQAFLNVEAGPKESKLTRLGPHIIKIYYYGGLGIIHDSNRQSHLASSILQYPEICTDFITWTSEYDCSGKVIGHSMVLAVQ